MALHKADTCYRYIVPKPQVVGWGDEQHPINAQVIFADGHIVVSGREEDAG